MIGKTVIAALISAALGAPISADSAPGAFKWTPTDGDIIAFDVYRKGNAFGSHVLTFSQSEDGALIVETDVELKAGIGPLTLFKYELDTKEVWREARLVELSGRTNDDGDDLEVEAARAGDALMVDGTEYRGEAPADIIPSSHWNIRQMYSDVMLSTETGELLEIDVEKVGRETVQVGSETVEAERYRLRSRLDVDLWYDDAGRWVKLAFEARGQEIEYRLRELYE